VEGAEKHALGERFDRALAWASSLHRGQRRKGGDVPYVSHLLAVAAIAIEHGASEDEAIAAMLHDAIEDRAEASGGAEKLRVEIRRRFGEPVLAIVEGCTDADTTPKPPWKERKERYLRGLETASPSVLLVSCADKLHNVRSTVSDLAVAEDREAYWKRFNGGKDGTLWYYRSLGKVFLQRLPGRLSDDLARAVLELTALAAGPRPG
jgi:(p)ppGpp synthase/HD superfamily hydrolase